MSEKLPPPRSLWEETAVPASDHVPVAGSVRAEIAVVGGGYTGLSAALHLAEAGRDVALIERMSRFTGEYGIRDHRMPFQRTMKPRTVKALGQCFPQKYPAAHASSADTTVTELSRFTLSRPWLGSGLGTCDH